MNILVSEQCQKARLPVFLVAALFSLQIVGHTSSQEVSGPQPVSHLAGQVLFSTEQALSLLDTHSQAVSREIRLAQSAIDQLEGIMRAYQPGSNKNAANQVFGIGPNTMYPVLDTSLFSNFSGLPTLVSKVRDKTIYRGTKSTTANALQAYLDTAFAKASLETARQALADNNVVEAKRALNRVFEAVYLFPDFVTE